MRSRVTRGLKPVGRTRSRSCCAMVCRTVSADLCQPASVNRKSPLHNHRKPWRLDVQQARYNRSKPDYFMCAAIVSRNHSRRTRSGFDCSRMCESARCVSTNNCRSVRNRFVLANGLRWEINLLPSLRGCVVSDLCNLISQKIHLSRIIEIPNFLKWFV